MLSDVLATEARCDRCEVTIQNTTTGRIAGDCPFCCGGRMVATKGSWQPSAASPPETPAPTAGPGVAEIEAFQRYIAEHRGAPVASPAKTAPTDDEVYRKLAASPPWSSICQHANCGKPLAQHWGDVCKVDLKQTFTGFAELASPATPTAPLRTPPTRRTRMADTAERPLKAGMWRIRVDKPDGGHCVAECTTLEDAIEYSTGAHVIGSAELALFAAAREYAAQLLSLAAPPTGGTPE